MNVDSSSLETQQLVVAQSGPTTLRPHGINKLPDELLMVVFEESVLPGREDAVWWEPDEPAGQYESVTRASLLTRVSKRWHSVALKTCRIWGCIRVPYTILQSGRRSTQLHQLIATLDRSGSTPLSVFLSWDTPGIAWPSEKSVSSVARRLFRALRQHAARWQRLRWEAPAEGAHGRFLKSLFGRATPCLEFIHVSSEHRVLENGARGIGLDTCDGLLPACPRLAIAYLGVDRFTRFMAPAAALVHLSVDSPAMHGKLWELLPCTPNIQTLRLSVVEDSMVGDMDVVTRDQLLASPTVLASLKCLEVASYWMSETLALATEYTRMPNLSQLVLPHSIIWEPACVDEVVLFVNCNGNALTEILVCEDTAREVYLEMSTGADTFWTSMSSTPFIAPRLRSLSMIEIVDIPGPRAWGALVAFRDARKDTQNAGASFQLCVEPDESPLDKRRPIALGTPPTGMLTARGMWY